MKKLTYLTLFLPFLFFPYLKAQNNNGQLDDLSEFSTMKTVPITMPDGTQLMTDVFVPITQDSLRLDIALPNIGPISLGTQSLVVIPKGIQLFVYDSINGQPSPNKYQLPVIFTRTPYGKNGDIVGQIVSLMGYGYALQDMRGRYESQGAYFPMFSDSWNKNPYHPNYGHVLDITQPNDPRHGNKHEDGYNSVQYLANGGPTAMYDLDGDGIKETSAPMFNGSVGMFGASALGNTQLQAAAAHRIVPNGPGLKCLTPIVATNEHYRYTGYQNGVFRDRIVTGWIRGQLADTDDTMIPYDQGLMDNIHSSVDYNTPDKFVASNKAIDHFSTVRYDGLECGYYPNALGRADMDASAAPVNAMGESVDPVTQTALPNLTHSRYENMDVPVYHLTGWWDIFIDGQIETWRKTRENIQGANQSLQKIVIGPWAHQTIGAATTGDMTYPNNVDDIIGIDITDIDVDNVDMSKIIQSEIISWFRSNLNYNDWKTLGEPKALIPESQLVQPTVISGVSVRVPAEDYYIPFNDLLNFLNGTGGLKGLKLEVQSFLGNNQISVDIPALGDPILDNLAGGNDIPEMKKVDFNDIPNVRLYVIGPVADGVAQNQNVGNYWMSADTFPISQNIQWKNMYLHNDGSINNAAPTVAEPPKIYVDDPDNPVITVGGANMIVRTPQDDRNSQGQMQVNHPDFINYTMDRPGVVQFETATIQDSLSVIGYPKVTLYGRANPSGLTSGETNVDFFVRVLDVYPDGREYFVFEGCVGARAREYAKAIYNGAEDRNAPFSNINVGQVYEYKFEMMPIAYTWGKDHKMKVLVSSSNYPRYQANSNLPMNDKEFFRRKPGDGQGYTFNGQFMSPRMSVQRIYFTPDYPTHLELPVYQNTSTAIDFPSETTQKWQVIAYPNPTSQMINVFSNRSGEQVASLHTITGQFVKSQAFYEDLNWNVSELAAGIYVLSVKDTQTGEISTQKITVE